MDKTAYIQLLEEHDIIAFDADDTLWDCQSHFEDIEHERLRKIEHFSEIIELLK